MYGKTALLIKFRFSKKATKFETISNMIWRLHSKFQIKWEIVSNFCGLLRMSEVYRQRYPWSKENCLSPSSNLLRVNMYYLGISITLTLPCFLTKKRPYSVFHNSLAPLIFFLKIMLIIKIILATLKMLTDFHRHEVKKNQNGRANFFFLAIFLNMWKNYSIFGIL